MKGSKDLSLRSWREFIRIKLSLMDVKVWNDEWEYACMYAGIRNKIPSRVTNMKKMQLFDFLEVIIIFFLNR